MSELENKTEEAPKRKRLTKEEREAAIANGTLKPRPRRTKKTEDGEDKEEVKELLILLHTFGLIQYTKGTHEFKFTFSKDLRRNTILEEIKGMLKVLNQDIQRMKVAIDTDDGLKKEEKDEMYKMLMRRIDETIEY